MIIEILHHIVPRAGGKTTSCIYDTLQEGKDGVIITHTPIQTTLRFQSDPVDPIERILNLQVENLYRVSLRGAPKTVFIDDFLELKERQIGILREFLREQKDRIKRIVTYSTGMQPFDLKTFLLVRLCKQFNVHPIELKNFIPSNPTLPFEEDELEESPFEQLEGDFEKVTKRFLLDLGEVEINNLFNNLSKGRIPSYLANRDEFIRTQRHLGQDGWHVALGHFLK